MHRRRDMMKLASALGLLAMMAACGDGSTTPAPAADAGPPADTAEAPECKYEDDKAGKNVGDLVENIKLKDSEGAKYELHSNCGVNKAIWVILATGW